MDTTGAIVELRDVRCRNPACGRLICKAHLPPTAVIEHHCRDCDWYTLVEGAGRRVVMLSATTAVIRAA